MRIYYLDKNGTYTFVFAQVQQIYISSKSNGLNKGGLYANLPTTIRPSRFPPDEPHIAWIAGMRLVYSKRVEAVVIRVILQQLEIFKSCDFNIFPFSNFL